MAGRRLATFRPETLDFLAELRDNNNREWFGANKQRYEEQVLDVALNFIQSMYEPLQSIAPHFVAVPKRTGGSLMRIYRDTRFAQDKTPYKTNIGIQFRHEQARDVHSPGYYLHIDPDEVFIGVGTWRPPPDALRQIRERIVARPEEWRRASNAPGFLRHFTLGGESLSRPPRGFDAAHPLVDDLKRKDFIAVRTLSHEDALAPRFQQTVERSFSAGEPLMKFLCKAVNVPF